MQKVCFCQYLLYHYFRGNSFVGRWEVEVFCANSSTVLVYHHSVPAARLKIGIKWKDRRID